MVVHDFRNLIGAQPFKPFRLVMSSGQAVDVRHPELAMMTRTSILISALKPNGRLGDHYDIFSLLHVTRIEFHDPLQQTTAEGQGENGSAPAG